MTIQGFAAGLWASQFTTSIAVIQGPRIEGLVAGVAEIGISLTVTLDGAPASGTIAWLADGVPITGATAASFTPTAAQEGQTLSVTVDASAPSQGALVYHQAPVAANALSDQNLTQSTGTSTADVAVDFTFAGTLVFTLQPAQTGLSIDSGTGLVSFNTNQLAVQTASTVIIRASDAVQPARFVDSAFSLTVAAGAVWSAPDITATGVGQVTLDAQGTRPPVPAAPAILSTSDGTVTLDAS